MLTTLKSVLKELEMVKVSENIGVSGYIGDQLKQAKESIKNAIRELKKEMR